MDKNTQKKNVLIFLIACILLSSEDIESLSERTKLKKENRFVPLSEGVTACVTHPLNNTIVAGTKVCGFVESTLIIFRPG